MTMYFEPFTFTLDQLTSFMEKEFKILSMDTISALESLRKELQMVESYLMDVDEIERRETSLSHVLTSHLQHLREIAFEIEDLLDMFFREAEDRSNRTMWKKLKSVFSTSSNPILRTRQVMERVEKLKQQLKETINRPKGYQIPTNIYHNLNSRRRPKTYPYMTTNDEFIVGLEEDIRSLVSILLVGKKDDDPARTLAIVGPGGSGKTTLARKLYNHKEIVARYPSRAWVCVSKEWNTSHLIHEICVQVGVSLQLGSETSSILFHKLHDFLKHRSYLIVLDDVWRVEALQDLLPILLSTSGGRVLVTSQNRKVITFYHLGGVYIHLARCLSEDESWELFCTIIRENCEGVCNFEGESSFARLGKKMLSKCNGLPLVVVTLAGFLSTKSTIQEWECVSKDAMSRIRKHDIGSHDYGAMEDMLQLCYLDLPFHLKPCFLYLGTFQEDDHICVEQLIQLWVAEGFVKFNMCSESESLEDLARAFLDELVQRCLVQVDGRDYEGKVQFVQIHDLMRDLCITKAKDLSFFEILSSSTLDQTSTKPTPHRIVIHKRNSFSTYNSRLRSFICFGDHGGEIRKLDLPYETMKLLRVLHLVKVDLGDSAEAVGHLALLRYLRIERCKGINELMQSTTTLKSMVTFVYNMNDAQSLASNKVFVSSMEQLRHISLSSHNYTNPGHTLSLVGLDKARHLQVLRAVAGEWIAKELCFLTFGLQDLQLTNVHSQAQLQAISNYVSNPYSHLHTLRISLRDDPRLEFHLEKFKLERAHVMKRLVLGGKIRVSFPLVFPPNLLSLELRFTKIEKEDDMKQALFQLHHLRHLILDSEAYSSNRLTMIGLPQLQELTLSNMSNLKEWRIENGGLSQLKMMRIWNCYKLEKIPQGIGFMTKLQFLKASFVSEKFCKRLQQPFGKEDINDDGGKDFHLIQHIPLVEIRNILKFHRTKKTYSI